MLSWRAEPVTVAVPATSANLGPGFDSFGLALSLHDVVTAQVTPSGLSLAVTGEGAAAAGAGEQHLVVRAMRLAFARLGGQPPGLALSARNEIPQVSWTTWLARLELMCSSAASSSRSASR